MKISRIILIVGVGLLLSGCYHETGNGDKAPTTQTAPAGDNSTGETEDGATVHYSGSGFSPSSISVEVGETVTFVNDGSGSMWVASSKHPTHKDLAGFDQLKGSGNGTSYSYTFEKIGEWSYHNHKSASHQGKVIVE